MRLLIDGYNLLHATDLFGAGELAGTLRGSREALVDFLATRLPPTLRRATVVVFDAADAPPGLPDTLRHEGITLRFARGWADADSLIEAMLEAARAPRAVTVVSGDRRVQRAARSCGARWVGSGEWFADLRRPFASEDAPTLKGSVGTTREWLEAFSNPDDLSRIAEQAAADPIPHPRKPPSAAPRPNAKGPADSKPSKKPAKRKRRGPLGESSDKPAGEFGAGVLNPFPPGYADDLEKGE